MKTLYRLTSIACLASLLISCDNHRDKFDTTKTILPSETFAITLEGASISRRTNDDAIDATKTSTETESYEYDPNNLP